MSFEADAERYERPDGWFRRCGRSGLKLPMVSLGCWHNFGSAGTDACRTRNEADMHENCRQMLFTAFDRGVTHIDLANNYGPPYGSAETRVGRILREDFGGYRDELIVSTKAGFDMWPGPYGDHGSRKYLVASCEQSLARLQLDYVDIFYHHRPDPGTPLEETMGALDYIIRSGRALYAGLSNYGPAETREALEVCRENGFMKPVINQVNYSLLRPSVDEGLGDVCRELGIGIIAYCPLAQGLLTSRYLSGIPHDSRAACEHGALSERALASDILTRIQSLNELADERGQTLARLALQWVVREPVVVSALIGASRPEQIDDCTAAAGDAPLDADGLNRIEEIIA